MLGLATLLFYALLATVAQASTVLIADTTLVSGSDSAVYSFEAPGPGTVSVQLTNLDWPQALSSLSFVATTANHVMSSWSDPGGSGAYTLSFQVGGSGAYFADVTAVAGGLLDLGVYSFSLDFTPAIGPVPVPASGWLLLAGLLALIGLRRVTPAHRSAA
ncbi:MAG: VPLPA-CTERM sorting domain-containing protein [Steroidobacteraceae bacterium]